MATLERLRSRSKNRAELLTHDTTRYAELLFEPGAKSGQPQHVVPLREGGIMLEDIARLAEPDVYGIKTFWQTKGFMRNSRGNVSYESAKIEEPGTVYIDGQVMSPGEAIDQEEKYKAELITRITEEGWESVVRTRSNTGWQGRWRPHRKGDMIISSKPINKSA